MKGMRSIEEEDLLPKGEKRERIKGQAQRQHTFKFNSLSKTAHTCRAGCLLSYKKNKLKNLLIIKTSKYPERNTQVFPKL